MLPAIRLIDFGFRQLVGMVPEAQAKEALAKMTGPAIQLVVKHFTDHSQTLPKALVNANDRAWQAVSIALAGDGFLDQIKVFFASADDKGIREQVRLFLQEKNIGYDGTPADFRQTCLDELNAAKKAGMLALAPKDVAERVANLQRYADPTGMVDDAEQVIGNIADDFASRYPNLSKLLRQPQAGGPPLLVASFSFFFRRAVETNSELAHGLFFDGLRKLSAGQEQSFEQLDRIENVSTATHTVVVETQEAVLDMQAEMQRLGSLPDEIRRLFQEIMARLSQAGMQKGEVKLKDSCSIHSEEERILVKQLLVRFRQLPAEQQKQVPALLNGLGKLQFGSQDFDGARQTFVAVAKNVQEDSAKAQAYYNAYRAALEEKKWDDALAAILKAAQLDNQRFAPFPLQRYEVKRILGAGAFGTAFHCYDRFQKSEVVVKPFHDVPMGRPIDEVFREAHALGALQHPAIIGVKDTNYTDLARMARPYIVMEYFPGDSLGACLEQGKQFSVEDTLQIARQITLGMLAAHRQGIMHRDIKPDNLLVRKDGPTWRVKIIDFGLALRRETIDMVRASNKSTLSESVGFTLKYAPPEQTGELKGVKTSYFSDVYAFGKTCCHALFGTTEPKGYHWKQVPDALADLLEQCTEYMPEKRLPNFEPVLKVLKALDPMEARRKQEEEARQKAELERQRREQDEIDYRLKAETERKLQEQVESERQQQAEVEKKRRDQEEGEGQQQAVLEQNRREREEPEPHQQKIETLKQKAERERHKQEMLKQIQEAKAGQKAEGEQRQAEREQFEQEPSKRIQEAETRQKADNKQQRKPGEVLTNSLGMKFAWIPPGSFLMGSPKSEPGYSENEAQHKVTLSKGFYMGVHAVTQEQWQAVMGNNPSNFKHEKNLPIERVSWEDCQEFIKKLRDKDKKAYRLPSEAEWEYACRAGTTTPFCFGETISTEWANYNGNCTYGNGEKGVDRRKTTPVASFRANAWGLFDMHGNVREWCQDWRGDYPQNDVVDPKGPNEGQYKVGRGGSWNGHPDDCRSAYRDWDVPAARGSYYGLRVCFCLD